MNDLHLSIDLSDQPEHVLAAIETLKLDRVSIARAEAGAKWFDENASKEWRLRLIRIHSGQISSRVNFRYNKDYPLGLAFAHDERFAKDRQENRWVSVAEHHGFKSPPWADEGLQKLGFCEREWRHGSVIVPKEADIELLNFGWRHVLGNFWEVGMVGEPVSRLPASAPAPACA